MNDSIYPHLYLFPFFPFTSKVVPNDNIGPAPPRALERWGHVPVRSAAISAQNTVKVGQSIKQVSTSFRVSEIFPLNCGWQAKIETAPLLCPTATKLPSVQPHKASSNMYCGVCSLRSEAASPRSMESKLWHCRGQ